MAQALPGVHVDANKVVSILREQLADIQVQNAVLTVALQDARACIADLTTALAREKDQKEANKPDDGVPATE